MKVEGMEGAFDGLRFRVGLEGDSLRREAWAGLEVMSLLLHYEAVLHDREVAGEGQIGVGI